MFENRSIYDRIVDKWTAQDAKMQVFQGNRDTIAMYFRPDLDIDVAGDDAGRGSLLCRDLYEGTAPWALHVASTGLRGNTVSESIDWITYTMKQFEFRGIDKLDNWCQDIKEHMTAVYRNSNFYRVQQRFTKDALSIGSPVMFIEENNPLEGIIKCMHMHYKHVRVIYDRFGEVDGFIMIDPTWTAKQIYDTFCKGKAQEERVKQVDDKFSEAVACAIKNGDTQKEFSILRGVFRSDDPVWDNKDFKKPKGNYKWLSVYFEYNSPKVGPNGDTKNKPLQSGIYYSRPGVVWDYDRQGHDPVSRTPCYYALYDVLSQQQVHKELLENGQLKNKQPLAVLSEMVNRLKLYPGGITEVEPNEYDRLPKPMNLVGDVQYNEHLSDKLAEAVKRHLHIDQYVMFSEIARMNKQPLTALQIAQIMGEKTTLLSPEIETQSKYLSDVDERFISIESEAGRGPFAPDVMANIIDVVTSNARGPVKTIGIVPQFIGTLNRAQKMQQQLAPIEAGLEVIAKHASVLGPSVTRAIKPYASLDAALTAVNFPMTARTEEKEFNDLVNADAQAAQQAQQTQTMLEAMKASKGIQGKVDPDSVMANMGKAMSGAAQ